VERKKRKRGCELSCFHTAGVAKGEKPASLMTRELKEGLDRKDQVEWLPWGLAKRFLGKV